MFSGLSNYRSLNNGTYLYLLILSDFYYLNSSGTLKCENLDDMSVVSLKETGSSNETKPIAMSYKRKVSPVPSRLLKSSTPTKVSVSPIVKETQQVITDSVDLTSNNRGI